MRHLYRPIFSLMIVSGFLGGCDTAAYRTTHVHYQEHRVQPPKPRRPVVYEETYYEDAYAAPARASKTRVKAKVGPHKVKYKANRYEAYDDYDPYYERYEDRYVEPAYEVYERSAPAYYHERRYYAPQPQPTVQNKLSYKYKKSKHKNYSSHNQTVMQAPAPAPQPVVVQQHASPVQKVIVHQNPSVQGTAGARHEVGSRPWASASPTPTPVVRHEETEREQVTRHLKSVEDENVHEAVRNSVKTYTDETMKRREKEQALAEQEERDLQQAIANSKITYQAEEAARASASAAAGSSSVAGAGAGSQ